MAPATGLRLTELAHFVPWTNRYNRHRPHAGIGSQTPISRLEVSP